MSYGLSPTLPPRNVASGAKPVPMSRRCASRRGLFVSGAAGPWIRRWLDTTRSRTWSATSWVVASVVFASLTLILGGPSQADSSQSVYSALLVAHGDVSCAYPPGAFSHIGRFSLTFASPLYTLVSAFGAWVLRVGSGTPFPSASEMGVNCSHAMTSVANWTASGNNLVVMLRIGFVSWLFLASGVIALMRASRQRRDGWEASVLLAVACSLPVVACLESFFHPEDLMAMGLILWAMASLVRGRWLVAGAFVALGILTQLFVVLVAVPLLFVLPASRLWRFISGSVAATMVVVAPLAIATSGRVLRAVLFGTSRAGEQHVTGAGGTVVFSAGLHGISLFLLSRVAPIAVATAVGWYSWRKWGARLREPTILVSLVGTCLAIRLVFEVNAFNYYYMASVVALLLLDALRGRWRGETFALIWLITLAYSPVAWGFLWRGNLEGPTLRALLPYLVSIPALFLLAASIYQRQVKWHSLI